MKSQIAVEFLVVFSIIATLSLLILNVVKITDTANVVDEDALDARGIADTLAQQINNVYLLGNGAKADIKLPDSLSKQKNYSISLINHLVSISWDDEIYTVPIIVGNVSSSFDDKDLQIRNLGGKIVIT